MILGWMAYALVVAGLVGSAAWWLDRGLRWLRLPTRWVWAAAIALSVAVPATALLSPRGDFAQQEAIAEEGEAEGEPTRDAGGALLPGLGPGAGASLTDRLVNSIPGRLVSRMSGGLDRAVGTAAAVLPSGPAVARWTLALWAGGSAAVTVLLLLSGVHLGRRRRRWPRVVLLGHAVRITPRLGPAVVGVVRPEIVVPASVVRRGEAELGMILAHEDQHLRARDPLLLAAGVGALLLLPWNAVLWWQLRQLRAAVEMDCDRRVLRRGASPRRYGALLLSVGSGGGKPFLGALALAGSRSLLARRLNAMKTRPLVRTIPLSLLAVAFATGLLVLACEADTPVATGPADDAAESRTSELDGSLAPEAETRRAPAGMRVAPELLDIDRVSARLAAACSALPQGEGQIQSASMRVGLDAAGRVEDWTEVHPSGSGDLDRALAEWFGDLRFSPMFENGRRVPVHIQMSVVITPAGQETSPARLVELRAPADDDTIVLGPLQVRCG